MAIKKKILDYIREEAEPKKDPEELLVDKEKVNEEEVKPNPEDMPDVVQKAYDETVTEKDDQGPAKQIPEEEDKSPKGDEEVLLGEDDDEDEDDKEDVKEEEIKVTPPKEVKNDLDEEAEEDMEDDDEELNEEEDIDKKIDDELDKIDVKEDFNALTKGYDLSEEFKKNVATIFEAAVKKNVSIVADKLQEHYNNKLQLAEDNINKKTAKAVDGYMNYVVEEWMTENKLAVNRGVQLELVESFIHGLKNLFEEHYIDVPSSKINLVEKLASKLEKTESQLNETLNKNVQLYKKLNEQKKINLIKESCDGLTSSESEKFVKLTENLSFEDTKSFANRLNVLKENYFPGAPVKPASEEVVEGGLQPLVESKDKMDRYADTISRMIK